MKQVVELLNEPTTPLIIKKDFIELLDIKTRETSLTYKFQTKDFEKFIQSHEMPKKVDLKTKSFVRRILGERNRPQPEIKQR
ncbi:MAG: hypothetical protein EKK61_01380 [Rickettsiales bacterium]|nr:MAG: hypothetical protein EKK61_01380 [Rickettsiales bacterium]